jgi:hypothetical protein
MEGYIMITNLDYGFVFVDTPINSTTINNGIVANSDTHTHDWGFLQPQNTGAPSKPWKAIAWSPELGIFCACLNTSSIVQHISTSSDGKTWTNPVLVNAGPYLTDIAWSSPLGLFVATSTYQGRVYTSSNGTSWSWNTVLNSAYAYDAVIWEDSVRGISQGGAFLAVGPNRIAISPFGTSGWAGPASPTNSDWSSIAYSPTLGIACAVASSGIDRVMVSNPTSVNFPWTAISGTMDTSVWRSIAWSEELGIFVAVGDGPTEAAYSYNGTTWTASSLIANHINRVKWCKGLGLFVAVSDFSTSNGVITSADGINWTKHASTEWGPQGGNTFALEWAEELGIFVSLPYNGSSNILSVPNNRLKSAGNQWRFTVDATEGYLRGITTKGLAKEDGSTDLTLKCSIYDSTGTSLIAESSTVLNASQIPVYTDSTTEYTSPEFAFNSVPLDTDTYTVVYEVDTHTAGYLEVVGVENGVAGTQGQFSLTGSNFHTDAKWDINLDLTYTDDISRIDYDLKGTEDALKFQVLDNPSGLAFSNLLTSEFSSDSGKLLFTDGNGITWVISSIGTTPVSTVVVDNARIVHLELTSGSGTTPLVTVTRDDVPSDVATLVADLVGYNLGGNSLYVSNNPDGLVGREVLPPVVEEDTLVETDIKVVGPTTISANVTVNNNSVLKFTEVTSWAEITFGVGGAIAIRPGSSISFAGKQATVKPSTLLNIVKGDGI